MDRLADCRVNKLDIIFTNKVNYCIIYSMVIHYILSCALLMKCKNIFYLKRNTYVYSRDS